MKRLVVLLFVFLANCSNGVSIKDDHPVGMIGSWISVNSAGVDTVLVLLADGSYKYSIFTKVDSATRDTSFADAGSWKVEYVDDNHNNVYDNPEDAYFYSYSTVYQSRKDYCHFNLSVVSRTDIFKLYAEEDSPLFTFQREGN